MHSWCDVSFTGSSYHRQPTWWTDAARMTDWSSETLNDMWTGLSSVLRHRPAPTQYRLYGRRFLQVKKTCGKLTCISINSASIAVIVINVKQSHTANRNWYSKHSWTERHIRSVLMTESSKPSTTLPFHSLSCSEQTFHLIFIGLDWIEQCYVPANTV